MRAVFQDEEMKIIYGKRYLWDFALLAIVNTRSTKFNIGVDRNSIFKCHESWLRSIKNRRSFIDRRQMHYSCLNKPRHASQFIIYLGNNTLSITWITPLSQIMSADTTVAPLIKTLPLVNLTSTNFPLTVVAEVIFITSAARCLPEMT